MIPPDLATLARSWGDAGVAARTAWGEARGEGDAGLIAVLWCIRNRVDLDLGHDGKPDWWGEGYAGVCLARAQFSCWLSSDPNRSKMAALPDTDPVLMHVTELARRVISGAVPDPTRGATHYLTRAAYLATPPDHWCHTRPACAQIGHHLFFRLV